jgi:hypothetical protein
MLHACLLTYFLPAYLSARLLTYLHACLLNFCLQKLSATALL